MFATTLDHFHLRSLDPDAAADFYVDLLGLQRVDRLETPDSLRVILAAGPLRLFIERALPETGPAAPTPNRGYEHLGLRVEDLDAAVAALKAKGVVFTMDPKVMGPTLKIAFLRGPDDVLIELLQRG